MGPRYSQSERCSGRRQGWHEAEKGIREIQEIRFNTQSLALKIQEGCHEPRNAWSL